MSGIAIKYNNALNRINKGLKLKTNFDKSIWFITVHKKDTIKTVKCNSKTVTVITNNNIKYQIGINSWRKFIDKNSYSITEKMQYIINKNYDKFYNMEVV